MKRLAIALVGNYGYLNQILTTVKSVLWHHQAVDIYILNPDIPQEVFAQLNQRLATSNHCIHNVKVDMNELAGTASSFERILNVVYAEFMIPELVDEQRVLYLDSDVIVDGDLTPLFKMLEPTDMLLAAKERISDIEQQFNSGVMLMNADRWRQEKLGQQLLTYARDHREELRNGDQTVVNAVLGDRIREIEAGQYNYQIGADYVQSLHQVPLADVDRQPDHVIWHFTTDDKPWNEFSMGRGRQLWWDYANLEWSEIVTHQRPAADAPEFQLKCMIFTQSGVVDDLERLIQEYPQIKFTIAAWTDMWFGLTRLQNYPNVRLLPKFISYQLREQALANDVFLDITPSGEQQIIDHFKTLDKPVLSYHGLANQFTTYEQFSDALRQLAHLPRVVQPAGLNGVYLRVKPLEASLDYILQHHCSVARFGDGEFLMMRGYSIPYQYYVPELGRRLRRLAGRTSDDQFMVCMPDVFERPDRYTTDMWNFWQGVDLGVVKECCTADWYGSTFISRPYIDQADKSRAGIAFDKLKRLWQDQDVLIVEGSTTRSGVGNDLFAGAKSIQRIIAPSHHCFNIYDELLEKVSKQAQDRLVLLMLGPTAKVLAEDLAQAGFWAIDIGHLDSEYEWYRMGAQTKVKLANKHTAEFNLDEGIEFADDPGYRAQIIADLSGEDRV